MAKKITMTFWRDDSSRPACLEYSWVPEGLRHTIQLDSGQREGSETDTISDELNPSHVQVYRLNAFEAASTENGSFRMVRLTRCQSKAPRSMCSNLVKSS